MVVFLKKKMRKKLARLSLSSRVPRVLIFDSKIIVTFSIVVIRKAQQIVNRGRTATTDYDSSF